MVRGSERRKDVGAMAERIARPQWSDDACAGTTCRRFDPITNKCVESAGDYYDLSSLKTQVKRHDQHNHSLSKANVSTFAFIVPRFRLLLRSTISPFPPALLFSCVTHSTRHDNHDPPLTNTTKPRCNPAPTLNPKP